MFPHDSNAVTDKPLTELERRAEIDSRVVARMAFEEDRRKNYMRGFWDCFYIVAILAYATYLFFFWKREE